MTLPIRVAVIGGGLFGREHVSAYAGMPSVQLVAIVEPNEKRRLEWLTDPLAKTVKIFSSVAEMLAETKLDAASIVTPSETRLHIATELMSAGVNILVEKPFANSSEDARKIAEVAATFGRICLPGHLLRFSQGHQDLKTKIAQPTFGSVVGVKLSRNRSRALISLYPDIHPALLLGVHDFDLAIWLTAQSVTQVSALEHRNSEGNIDYFVAQCLHDGGAISTIQVSCLLSEDDPARVEDDVSVFGERGTAHLKSGSIDNESAHLGFGQENAPLVAELQYFLGCVLGNRQPTFCTPEEGVHVVEIAQAVIQSASSGGEITRLRVTSF